MFRRCCGSALVSVIVGAMLATAGVSPASADSPEAFGGTATGRGLLIKILGTSISVGDSHAEANSTPMAKADGAGSLLIASSKSTASQSGADGVQAPPRACGLPLNIAGIDLGVACSSSKAEIAKGAPHAAAEGEVLGLNVALPLVSALLGQTLGTVATTVQPVLGSVDALLNNITGPLLGPNALQKTVSDLITALQEAQNLVSITAGRSTSEVTTQASGVAAVATAQGATIKVLPALNPPLIEITVGKATANSVFDRGTGKSNATFDPALLTLRVLGLNVPVAFGSPIVLFGGTALESTISLGAGKTVTNADGSVGAVSDGVGVALLTGLGGGIVVQLAHAESAVGGNKAVVSTQVLGATPLVQPEPELAKTGEESAWLPIGFALLVAAYAVRRVARARR